MKNILLIIVCCFLGQSLSAQNSFSTHRQLVFSSGFVSPQLNSGTELTRALDLRENGLSYFEDASGSRAAVGTYPSNSGFSLSIGYYAPVRKIPGLSLGAVVNSGQTGSTPSEGGYEEGYFFNFLNFSGVVRYLPFEENNLYVRGEFGMGSVFTKNRFQTAEGAQDFLHHFGIGLEGGAGAGYILQPFANKELGIQLEVLYQVYSTRVEVSGIGDDQWQFGALHISAGILF
jgi:hypothetical protein